MGNRIIANALPRFTIHEAVSMPQPLQSSKPVLYTHMLCPYAQRVFLALLCKQFPFELVHVDLTSKPKWYSSVINPRGLVPAVDYRGIHTESMDVCRWLESTVPEPALTPVNPAARQQMDRLLGSTSSVVAAGLDLCSGSNSHSWGLGSHPSKAQQQRFEQEVKLLANALQQLGGPFLAGEQMSLADVALFPFLERFEMALLLQGTLDMSLLHGGGVSEWLGHMRSLPCCAVASPDAALFKAALRQHQSLDFFDFIPYSVFALHPHLRHQSAGPQPNA